MQNQLSQTIFGVIQDFLGLKEEEEKKPEPKGLASRPDQVNVDTAVDVSLRPKARPVDDFVVKLADTAMEESLRPRARPDIPIDPTINNQKLINKYNTSVVDFRNANKGGGSAGTRLKVNTLNDSDSALNDIISRVELISKPMLRPRARPKSIEEIQAIRASQEYTDLDTTRGLQAALNNAGITVNGKPLVEDGIMGALTEKAIKAFQKREGLEDDGIAGPLTKQALYSVRPQPKITEEKLEPAIPLSQAIKKRPGKRTLDPFEGTLKKVEDFLTTEDEDLQDQYEQDSIEAKEIVIRPRARPDDVESIPTGIMVRPRSRPNDAVPVTSEVVNLLEGITNPIDAVIKLGYIKDRNVSTRKKKSRYESLLNEKDNNDTIAQMFMDAIGEFKNPMKTAWCATFVDHILNELGVKRLETDDKYDRLRAKAYENYGDAVENINAAKRGDIAVIHGRDIVYDRLTGEVITDTLSREDLDSKYRKDTEKYKIAPGYHVGFIESIDDKTGTVNILGGNQRDSVSLSAFKENYIISIRRIVPEDVGKPIL